MMKIKKKMKMIHRLVKIIIIKDIRSHANINIKEMSMKKISDSD